MKTRFLTALAILSFACAAAADIRPTEDHYEVDGRYVQLPSSAAGSVIFRDCARCEPTTLRVNAASSYTIDGRAVSLAQLRTEFDNRKRNGQFLIVVFSDVETKYVTRISMERIVGSNPNIRK